MAGIPILSNIMRLFKSKTRRDSKRSGSKRSGSKRSMRGGTRNTAAISTQEKWKQFVKSHMHRKVAQHSLNGNAPEFIPGKELIPPSPKRGAKGSANVRHASR
jgi:hypothetical protein